MKLPDDYFYTRDDTWLRRDGDTLTIGLTEYGQNELGELVFVELPESGAAVRAGTPFGVVESVKAVAELVSPLAGKVVASNEEVAQEPALVNESPYERGWLVRVEMEGENLPPELMTAAQYASFRP